MSKERELRLFNAVTNIRDDLIDRAQYSKANALRRSWKPWAAIAACAVLAVGAAAVMLQQSFRLPGGSSGGAGAGGSGHADGSSVFMSYAGPVFPLTLSEQDSEITANRHIAYDFSLAREDSLRVWGAHVQDNYTLLNHSSQQREASLLYPFAGSFNELAKQMPTITVDGELVSPTLHPGGYSGSFTGVHGADDPEGSSNVLHLDSWEGYKALLESGGYQAKALADYPSLGQQVTVYSFTDFEAPLDEFNAASQAITFTINPEKTTILLYGFNGGEYGAEGQRRFSYFVPNETRRESSEKYIVVLGDDIGEYALQGYKNGAIEKGNELDGVSASVTRTERILSDVLGDIVKNFILVYDDGKGLAVSDGMFLGAVSEFMLEYGLLSGSVRDRYDTAMLEDMISETKNLDRIFYLEFPVTIPAGRSASVMASMHKQPSYDFHCTGSDNVGVQGYDMVTRIGSNLYFDAVTAEITNIDEIEIVRQNFGFDTASGVTKVSIDPTIEHYYLEIK
ncbi:MAG: hypothetical protein ACOX8S_10940 [Christensenellales bacterium]|jgi:hypothetical protein